MGISRMDVKMRLFRGLLTVFIFLMNPFSAVADELSEGLSACAKIDDDAGRLACFDRLARRPVTEPAASSQKSQAGEPLKPRELSVLEKHWDLKETNRRHSFVLRPYRQNYFLPVAYNSSPNDDTNLEYDPKSHAQFNEAKFQISFKAKVWEDLLQKPLQRIYDGSGFLKGMDIWVAYTQLSFWQLYNSAFSAPFRDTNYEPELLLNFRSGYEIPGLSGTKLQYFNIGFNHQSNGRSRPLSRSWNRIISNTGLERGNFNVQLKAWYRLPEDEDNDDNPDILRFMGYGEFQATYFLEKQRFAVMLRNNLRSQNLGAVQLDWSVPPITLGRFFLGSVLSPETLEKYFTDKFSLYFQYFNGYGEGLMDYNKSINRISVGLMIADWN